MTVFIEERLLDCVAYGTAFGRSRPIRRIAQKSGIVNRNAMSMRSKIIGRLLYSKIRPPHHIDVVAAWETSASLGGAAFRVRDWSDYQATNELLTVLGTGSLQTVQLTKLYEFGAYNYLRPIYKPAPGTVVLTANGTPISSTTDYTTGEVSFTASASAVLRWSGEFDVPMFFSSDDFMASVDNRGVDGFFLTCDVALEEDLAIGQEETGS